MSGNRGAAAGERCYCVFVPLADRGWPPLQQGRAQGDGDRDLGVSLHFGCSSPAGPRKSLQLSALASPFKNKKVIVLISRESSFLLLVI